MPQTPYAVDKRAVLQQQGVLNSWPETVTDPLFHRHPFFDPRDLVQVKYEMLRRVHIEKQPIRQATVAFGFSRPGFYQAQALLRRYGLFGLIPQKRGPRQAHKLTPAVLDFLEKSPCPGTGWRPGQLAQQVEARFGLRIHPRSIARTLSRQKKQNCATPLRRPAQPR